MSLAERLDSLPFKYHFLMPLLAKLPQQAAYRLASLYGRLQFPNHAAETDTIIRQMQTVFMDKEPAELEDLARYFFCMVEREALDTWYFRNLKSARQVDRFIKMSGFENVLDARKEGKRVIISSGHYGRFWMVGLGMKAHGVSMGAITRDGKDTNVQGLPEAEFRYRLKKLSWLQQRFEGPFLIEGEGVRPIFRALDEHVMAVLIDVPQVQANKTGCIELPFLGKTGVFPLGTARIAKKAAAVIVPFYVNESRQGLEIQFHPGLDAGVMEEKEIMQHLVERLEYQILESPEQWWLWQALPLFVR